jgi:hypothetical protein
MRKLVVVLSLAVSLAAGACVWLWSELRAERGRSAELAAQLQAEKVAAHLAERVEQASATAASPVSQPSPLPQPAPTPVTAQNPTNQATTRVQGTQEEWEAYQHRLLSDPKYRAAWSDQQRVSYAPRRANLIRLLGFSAEKADAVIEVMIERELALMQKRPHTPQQIEADEAAYQSRLRTLLGDEQRQRLGDYMASRASRMQVDRFRGQLSGADAMRDDQVEPLIGALHQEQAQMRKELAEYRETLRAQAQDADSWRLSGERETELMKAAHRRMLAAAGSLLTQAQLDALEAMLAGDLQRHEAQQRMRRLQGKLSTPAAVQPP